MSTLLRCLAAFAMAVVATACLRRLAQRLNLVSRPNPIVAQHTRPVAYLGGAGIALGVAGGLLAGALVEGTLPLLGRSPDMAIAAGSVAFLTLGIVDDLRVFSPPAKFALQTAAASLAVLLGLAVPWTGIAALDRALSALYILVFLNAFNFIDVCDGLLAGVASAFFVYAACTGGGVAPLAQSAAAASLGFLVFNRPPATIFMGDAGSHVLGFLAAATGIAGARESGELTVLAATAIAAGVPLYETVFITSIRVAKGLPWWRGSPDHFALRLQAAGLTALETDLLAWSAAALLGVSAAVYAWLPAPWQVIEVAMLLSLAAAVSAWLLRIEHQPIRRRAG